MESVIKESTSLYFEIDDCITELLKARLDKDTDKEHEAICKMESLEINTMQHLSWLVGELKGHSLIKWKTGDPKEDGEYLVSLEDGSVCRDEWRELYCEDDIKCWVYNEGEVTAWCKLSDIKSYKAKEETK